jgi:hypothetical protein
VRPIALLPLFLLACAAPASPAPDATVDAPSPDAAPPPDVAPLPDAPSACPIPLGTAAPRPTPPTFGPLDDTLRVHHLQAKGTHNSYHLRPALPVPDWDYSHAPLDVQFAQQGVRAIELDLHWTDDCERFLVRHIPVVDGRTTCETFAECLTTVRRWSDANPSHHPLFIHLEPKGTWPDATVEARFTAMEREILSVFPRELVITPDEVRGPSPTLAEAIRARGWPTLRATRGRVLFYIDRTDNLRTIYTHNGRDLNGRLAFIDSAATDPFAGVLVLNNARSPDVLAAVRQNFLVRVFAWSAGDMRDDALVQAAFDSGAQIVSTDFPGVTATVTRPVEVPNGTPSRCNPLTAPMGCTSEAIERLPR